MKITIITVVKNCALTIERNITSVWSQRKCVIEHIIVDSCSTDGTTSIVHNCIDNKSDDRINVRHIVEQDRSLWEAMNKGLKLATGELVAYLNADDFYSDDSVLENVTQLMQRDKALTAVFGWADIVDTSGHQKKIVRKYRVNELSLEMLRRGLMPAHPAFFCRRSALLEVGGFVDDPKIAVDFELMIRLTKLPYFQSQFSANVFTYMETGGLGNSSWGYRLGRVGRQKYSCDINGLKTSYALLYLKYFRKVLEFIQ